MRDFEANLARMLRRHGCPAPEAMRLVGEIENHRADLHTEGLESGLHPAEAEAWAAQQLGSPESIAASFIRVRRNRDWLGRHPLLLFVFIPLILFILGFAAAVFLVASVGTWKGWWNDPVAMDPSTWMRMTLLVPFFHFSLLLIIPAAVCRLAGRYGYGWKWALLACLIFAAHSFFHFIHVDFPSPAASGQIVWGYRFSTDVTAHLWKGMPPLLLFGHYFLRTRLPFRTRLQPNPNPVLS